MAIRISIACMFLRFILLLLSAILPNLANAEASDPLAGLAIPAPSVVVFWAAWCAPCRAEVSAWPELQRAAGSLPVHFVVLDMPVERSRSLLKALPADRVHHGRGSSFLMLTAWPDRASGLPFALLLDVRGRICASQNGGLTVERVAAMRRRCTVPPAAASGRPSRR